MQGSAMFNTVAHCTTVFYYAQVLRHIAGMTVTGTTDRVLLDFLDFRPKFFTIWGLAAQALLFALCVLHDASRVLPESSPVRRGARGLRDLILVGVSGPAAVTVTALFWSLFLLDRDLVMPAALDALVPAWLNHAMHSFVLVLVVVQVLAEPHHPPPLAAALGLGATVSAAYFYTLYGEFAQTGRWIYPVFGVLGWPGRVALSVSSLLLFLSQVALIWLAVKARWGHAKSAKALKRRKD